MNLNAIVAPYITSVNPWITGSYQQSDGYTKNADYSRVPSYLAAVPIEIQMQAMTYSDLSQVSGLNLNGEIRAMYCNGNFEGVSRPEDRGGDLITLPDGSLWLIVHVLENWNSTAGWTKFACVRQTATEN